jgi:hypothetical protein
MRLASLSGVLLVLLASGFAQDANFPSGPQYLPPPGASPQFLQSIATPSLDLNAPPANPPVFENEFPAEQPPSTGPEAQTDFARIYWTGPTLPENVSEQVSEIEQTAQAANQEPARTLPAAFVDVGVWAIETPQFLRKLGYGESLAQAAAYWKAHKTPVSHVYTNADIQRLHGG